MMKQILLIDYATGNTHICSKGDKIAIAYAENMGFVKLVEGENLKVYTHGDNPESEGKTDTITT